MGKFNVVELGPDDIDRIMELERQAFDPPLQAKRETVLRRLALGHFLLGAERQGRLVGALAYSYLRFDPQDREGFPRTFKAYSMQPTPADYDTAALYSLGIEPAYRGLACVHVLLDAVTERARRDGCVHGIADGHIPSLAGNAQVRPNPAIRAMIDRYVRTGQFPAQEEFLQDPVLALYQVLTGCRFWWLLPDFLPEDWVSEGWRVLLYRKL